MDMIRLWRQTGWMGIVLITSALLVCLGTAADIRSAKRDEDSKSKNDTSFTATTLHPQSGVLVKAGTTLATSKATTAETTRDPNGDFIVKVNDKVCIRAFFKVSFTVKYAVRKKRRLFIHETVTSMPERVSVSGTCFEDHASLTVGWDNNTYSLTITFNLQTREQKEPRKDSETKLYGWGMSKATWVFDTSDPLFTNPIHPGKHTMRTEPSENYFFAPRNRSFSCTSKQRLVLNEYNDNESVVKDDVLEVLVDLENMRIQAFDIPPSGEYSEAALCDTDIYNNLPHQNIVPIIVAACLSGIIVIIIIAYFITKNLGQSPYKAMD